jgi:hypothetical protein
MMIMLNIVVHSPRSAVPSRTSNGSGNQGASRLSPSSPGVTNRTGALTAQEFRRIVKCDIAHYPDLKDDKGFRIWNRGFVSKSKMHHTHLVLDETYVPKTDKEKAVFQEMQIFMYAVTEEHLKMDKGKSLVSQYEVDNDAQSIYCELKKHSTSSTAAWLAGDTLMKYIINAKYPGEWRGTSFGFVLHWQEQLAKYEELDLEITPPKQKLRMLQNAVGDLEALARVKLMNDHDIARGHPPLTYEKYVQVLLSTCSTYDSQRSSGDQKKRAVYQSKHAPDIDQYDDLEYAAYSVDTDVVDIMAYAADTTRFGNRNESTNQSSNRIPYSEWIQLPEEQRNKILAKRKQERLDNARKSQPSHTNTRRANTHHVETYIDLDSIIDNAVMYEDADPNNDSEVPTGPAESNNNLLAYMAGSVGSKAGS